MTDRTQAQVLPTCASKLLEVVHAFLREQMYKHVHFEKDSG